MSPNAPDDDLWWVDPLRICLAPSTRRGPARAGLRLDPWDGSQWGIDPFDELDVTEAELHDPDSCECVWDLDICRYCHLHRIARLVVQPLDPLDPHPITIDSYCRHWPVLDGNHRLVAALLRGDRRIPVSPQGDLDELWTLLVASAPGARTPDGHGHVSPAHSRQRPSHP